MARLAYRCDEVSRPRRVEPPTFCSPLRIPETWGYAADLAFREREDSRRLLMVTAVYRTHVQ